MALVKISLSLKVLKSPMCCTFSNIQNYCREGYKMHNAVLDLILYKDTTWEHSGSVVECLT